MRKFKLYNEETVFEMLRTYQNTKGRFNELRKKQNELYDFTVPDLQWDAAVKKKVLQSRRPANSYNILRPILNAIIGVEKDNRKIGKAKPRTDGDIQLADKVSDVLNYYLYNTNYEDVQRRVFLDQIIARYGVYHVGWEYQDADDDEGSLFVKAVDPRQLMFEPVYDDPHWEKANYIMRKHQLSIEEILATFALNDPEMQKSLMEEASLFFEKQENSKWVTQKLKALFSAVYETATQKTIDGDNVYRSWFDSTSGKFDVLELHEKRMEKRLILPDQRRKRMFDITEIYKQEWIQQNKTIPETSVFDPNLVNHVKKKFGLEGPVNEDVLIRRFQTIIIPVFRMVVSEKPYPVDADTYVYIPQYCYNYHADPLKTQSLMDDLIDPQKDFNKSKSLLLELLARYSNKGWIMDENAITGLEEDWETNAIAPYRRVRSGYINMIKPETSPTLNPELVKMPIESQQMMRAISNADSELRGNSSPGVTSGRHFLAKERQQVKSFTHILENRDKSQKRVYELALKFIQHFVTTQKVIRITEDDDKQIMINQPIFEFTENGVEKRIVDDISAYEYDIEISDAPYSGSVQEEKYNKLGDLFSASASVNPQKADALLDIFVKVADFPEKDKILEAWQNLTPQPTPEEQAQQAQLKQVQQQAAQIGLAKEKEDLKGKALENKLKETEYTNRLINLLGVQNGNN